MDESTARIGRVLVWTAVNLALLVVFSMLLAFDDRIARAAGF